MAENSDAAGRLSIAVAFHGTVPTGTLKVKITCYVSLSKLVCRFSVNSSRTSAPHPQAGDVAGGRIMHPTRWFCFLDLTSPFSGALATLRSGAQGAELALAFR